MYANRNTHLACCIKVHKVTNQKHATRLTVQMISVCYNQFISLTHHQYDGKLVCLLTEKKLRDIRVLEITEVKLTKFFNSISILS